MDAVPPVDHFSFGKDKKCRKTCYNKLKFQAEDDGGKNSRKEDAVGIYRPF